MSGMGEVIKANADIFYETGIITQEQRDAVYIKVSYETAKELDQLSERWRQEAERRKGLSPWRRFWEDLRI